MDRTIIFAVVLLAVLSQTFALENRQDVSFSSNIKDACLEFGNKCCTNSACSVRYTMSGLWETQTGQKCEEGCERCNNICEAHNRECERKCGQLFRVVTQSSSDNCKCVRDLAGTEGLRTECKKSCSTGKDKCINVCGSGTCPLVAKMEVKYTFVVPGFCKATCPAKFFPAPANCPAVEEPDMAPKPDMPEEMVPEPSVESI